MPQRPRKMVAYRLDQDLMDEVRAATTNITLAIEEGLRMWLDARRGAPPHALDVAKPSERLDTPS